MIRLLKIACLEVRAALASHDYEAAAEAAECYQVAANVHREARIRLAREIKHAPAGFGRERMVAKQRAHDRSEAGYRKLAHANRRKAASSLQVMQALNERKKALTESETSRKWWHHAAG